MLFNSTTFLVFFTIFFFVYWFVVNKNLKAQNLLILVSSYIFYGWWDWRFVFLLILSTLIDYVFGLAIYNSIKHKKFFLWLSIFNNLAILAFFKYYNFFVDSIREALFSAGWQVHPYMLTIVLPVGISFYTFHGMSYVFDIYNGKSRPTKNFVDYAVFVCFFPLLVAGPIERANHLLPQVIKPRKFNYGQAIAGLRIILWGFFKKLVIADGIAVKVNYIFENYQHLSGLTLAVGAIYFAIQIYCDFSGYSDIAIGTAKLLGFELLVNFRFPYFSRDIAEFWRRWHISLSSWFKDYLYIPLGGSKEGKFKSIRNTFIIFTVSGFWHGANWTFIAWGVLHALYFIPLLLLKRNRRNLEVIASDRSLPTFREITGLITTFILVCFAWIFFRAENMHHAKAYIVRMFSGGIKLDKYIYPHYMLLLIVFLFCIEWFSRKNNVAYMFDLMRSKLLRYSMYFLILMLLVMYGSFTESSFIYFQF